jgi:hypothetical protein
MSIIVANPARINKRLILANALEKQFKDLTIEQRYLLRQEKSKPLLEALKQWCLSPLLKSVVWSSRALLDYLCYFIFPFYACIW